ncbi:hypothetical protein OIDMADRAFT_32242 [Oidiodendron maius Zn]|uniref:Uncharacterized protein n=1 Tax=Oidiodendron maius (strain Zn) TaxID=913774 RepID=A0A0C3H430_OIDMZ|nr:hypothetical protein OIDMADRAFT_32242 [Oidiodendron maius Zn]
MRMGIDAKDDAEMMQGLSDHWFTAACKPGFKIGRIASTVALHFTLIRNANCVRVDNTMHAVMVPVIRDPTYCGMPSERFGALNSDTILHPGRHPLKRAGFLHRGVDELDIIKDVSRFEICAASED